jgi:hypothetical protein
MNKTQRSAFDQLMNNTYDFIGLNGGKVVRRNLADGMVYRKALAGKTFTPLKLDFPSSRERAATPVRLFTQSP